jgi:ADP-ribosylglycohydrolase
MSLPIDYAERVYAGVLGKIIGVYLGRPFEGWPYQRIMNELGEINYYVHDRLGVPLVVTDDDISGTFTFLRALPDYGNSRSLTPEQIGQTWLNYLIEKRTILWWGGVGNSTEHTAYQRLKSGMKAPASGSIATNGKTVAEQIGAQIFIDGWAMVAPGDPEFAAELARRAGSVSHDGESVYGAQVVAAMESQAFVESDIACLLDTATGLIPTDSTIYRLIAELRDLREKEDDWRVARKWLETNYGYQHFEGVCHMVPNHGLIVLSLLYGDDDFQKTLMICNTSGWDTDCNSGNVGCLMGIKNGLAGIDAGPDWRGPVADRLYIPTADGGRSISDAATESQHIINIGRALQGQAPSAPKDGARFHFEFPGAVQGFMPEKSIEVEGTTVVENVEGFSATGRRSLAIRYRQLAPGRASRVATHTFIPRDAGNLRTYTLIASPTVYPGQTVTAAVQADPGNQKAVKAQLYVRVYEAAGDAHFSVGPEALRAMEQAVDALVPLYGPETVLEPGSHHEYSWTLPETEGRPIGEIGLEITPVEGAIDQGAVYLDYLTWSGAPQVRLGKPARFGKMWSQAWTNGMDDWWPWWPNGIRLMQNEGTGLLVQGTREWTDYQVASRLTPHLSASAGIGVRVQGMRRYYALLLRPGDKACLVKALDGETILAESEFRWDFDKSYDLKLAAEGSRLRAWIDDVLLFDVEDHERPLDGGAAAVICQEGTLECGDVFVGPVA